LDGRNGYLVEVTDTDKFAEKILTLAAEPAHRRYLGKFSGEDFSYWDADFMTRQQEELYMKLLGKSCND
jgi:glycosyltransferase involved in cell wall biosynthesis